MRKLRLRFLRPPENEEFVIFADEGSSEDRRTEKEVRITLRGKIAKLGDMRESRKKVGREN